jgi:signal peptidase I
MDESSPSGSVGGQPVKSLARRRSLLRLATSPKVRRRAIWLVCLTVGVTWSFLAITRSAFSWKVYMVPTGSMAPAIKAGDSICVAVPFTAKPKRGEIWTFEMPSPKGTAVKRVIGLPGETIEVRKGRVFLDRKALDEPYLSAPFTYSLPPTRLGPTEYFLLGDSRDLSNDSHIFGPIKQSDLIGRVKYRYWPPARAGGF